VTVEEGCIMGGAGAAVAEALAAEGIVKPVLMLGLPDQFIDHGDPAKLLASVGLDAAGITPPSPAQCWRRAAPGGQ
jgi:1-deoxy-D-xylulose-5-phosphate synthase